jgi:hypothetical protein
MAQVKIHKKNRKQAFPAQKIKDTGTWSGCMPSRDGMRD